MTRKKSEILNLSFPYDWSNPNMSDEVLIAKVVERGIFEDIARVSVKFGIGRVRAVVQAFSLEHPIAASGLSRMLNNIERAVNSA